MTQYAEAAVGQLCQSLGIEPHFFYQCLSESVIEIREVNGRLELDKGTLLHLRRLERICTIFEMDVPMALLVRDLRQKVADLKEQARG